MITSESSQLEQAIHEVPTAWDAKWRKDTTQSDVVSPELSEKGVGFALRAIVSKYVSKGRVSTCYRKHSHLPMSVEDRFAYNRYLALWEGYQKYKHG